MRSSPLFLAASAGMITFSPQSTMASETVSPGDLDRVAVADTACPAFSWTTDPEARSYELLVHELGEGASGEPPSQEPVLHARLPAGAASWTPDQGRCLEPGARYAWLVAAVGPEGEAAWSKPRFFSVAAAPSAAEIAQALETLRRYLERVEGLEPPAASFLPPATTSPGATAPGSRSAVGQLALDSASAGLRAECRERLRAATA